MKRNILPHVPDHNRETELRTERELVRRMLQQYNEELDMIDQESDDAKRLRYLEAQRESFRPPESNSTWLSRPSSGV